MKYLHAQLLDETVSTIDTLRRNIRLARELGCNLNRELHNYDDALKHITGIETELALLVEREAAIYEEEADGS